MAKSAMWKGSSWTIKPGLSVILRWQREIGGPARRYWCHRGGFNGSAGRIPKSTLASREKPSKAVRSSSNQRPSLVSMKTGSIFTTAYLHIGWKKPNKVFSFPDQRLREG